MTISSESFDVPALIDFMQSTMGVNPFTIYCQLTGKPIGRINPDELEPFLRGDVEEVADDLFVRIIASMRPSIHWNYMRESSLADLAKSRPIETLAYLLNRLFQPQDWLKVPMARKMSDLHHRIQLYDYLVANFDREWIRGLTFMLLEIDAKMNLSQQSIDLRIEDFMLFGEESTKVFESWYATCIKQWTRNQKAEEDSRRWYKGNTLARPAFFTAFMEAKPESKAAATKRIKKERDAELDALFDEVMAEAAKPASESSLDTHAEKEGATTRPVLPVSPEPQPVAVVSRKIPAFLMKKKG